MDAHHLRRTGGVRFCDDDPGARPLGLGGARCRLIAGDDCWLGLCVDRVVEGAVWHDATRVHGMSLVQYFRRWLS